MMEVNMGWISTAGHRLPDIDTIAIIQESLGRVSGVTGVAVSEGGFDVLTTYSGSRKGREKIYKEQERLMDKYPDILFDFSVVAP